MVLFHFYPLFTHKIQTLHLYMGKIQNRPHIKTANSPAIGLCGKSKLSSYIYGEIHDIKIWVLRAIMHFCCHFLTFQKYYLEVSTNRNKEVMLLYFIFIFSTHKFQTPHLHMGKYKISSMEKSKLSSYTGGNPKYQLHRGESKISSCVGRKFNISQYRFYR